MRRIEQFLVDAQLLAKHRCRTLVFYDGKSSDQSVLHDRSGNAIEGLFIGGKRPAEDTQTGDIALQHPGAAFSALHTTREFYRLQFFVFDELSISWLGRIPKWDSSLADATLFDIHLYSNRHIRLKVRMDAKLKSFVPFVQILDLEDETLLLPELNVQHCRFAENAWQHMVVAVHQSRRSLDLFCNGIHVKNATLDSLLWVADVVVGPAMKQAQEQTVREFKMFNYALSKWQVKSLMSKALYHPTVLILHRWRKFCSGVVQSCLYHSRRKYASSRKGWRRQSVLETWLSDGRCG